MLESDSESNKEQPWYKDGICFSCTACGDCCGGAPGYVWVDEAEKKLLADHLEMDIKDFNKQFIRKVGKKESLIEQENYDCTFLKKGKCTVYEARPIQCRTFPFWKAALKDREEFVDITLDCPGTGCGKLWKKDEIESIRDSSPI